MRIRLHQGPGRTWALEEAIGPLSMQRPTGGPLSACAKEEITLELRGGFAARSAASGLGILSLSKRWDSPLMWAHYAGSGRGFVLALRMDHPFLKGQDLAVISTADSGADDAPDQLGPGVSPDRYDETRPRTGDLMRNQISYADCLIRGSDWQYEQECRAFRNLNRTPQLYKARLKAAAGFRLVWSDLKDLLGNPFVLLDVPPDAIHEIITAANMAATEISAIARILLATPSLRHVGLSTARLSSIGFAFGTAQR